MENQSWAARPVRLYLLGVLGLLSGMGISAQAQAPPAPQEKPPAAAPVTNAATAPQIPREKAWGILREALKEDSADKRAKAVRALGLLPGNAEAGKAAIGALKDDKVNVRVAAAVVLGSIHAENAASELENALTAC